MPDEHTINLALGTPEDQPAPVCLRDLPLPESNLLVHPRLQEEAVGKKKAQDRQKAIQSAKVKKSQG